MKGTGLLKLCVLSLFTLGISYFGLLGSSYVNAGGVIRQIGTYGVSPYDNGYDINVLSKGTLLTQQIGFTKNWLYLNNEAYWFWSYDSSVGFNNLYSYINGRGGMNQGFVNTYALCPELTGVSLDYTLPTSECSEYEITSESYDVFHNFLSTVNQNDYFYVLGGRFNNTSVSRLCYSSHEYGKSLCFGNCRVSSSAVYSCSALKNTTSLGNTHGSYDFGSGFGAVPISYFGNSPGLTNQGSSITGGSQVVDETNQITGDTVSINCTKNLAFQWYRANGYKSRMCYSSYGNTSDLYTGPGDAQAYDLTGVSIEDVWFNSAWYRRNGLTGTSMPYSEWFSYWRNTYNAYKKNSNHTNPFLGVPVSIFTLMGNVDAYGLPYNDASVLEFCDLSLYTADYSAQYTGIAQNTVCSLSAIDLIELNLMNGENPDDGLPGYGNSVFNDSNGTIGSSWDGITNRPGFHNVPGHSGAVNEMSGLSTFTDGKSFQNNFFNLLKSHFKYVDSGGHDSPIIPTYIVIFLCGLVLFRFISH